MPLLRTDCRRHSLPRAFTLIELLVVLAIMAIVFGMGVATLGVNRPAAHVQAAAEELAATLRQARSLAMSRNAMHGVAFHIQNAPGSSGAVLNNRSGGHYYRIIGPKGPQNIALESFATQAEKVTSMGIPGALPQVKTFMYDNRWSQFLTAISESWIGPARPLPKGKVRFLALGDTDEGPMVRTPHNPALWVWYGSNGETTYPRPYFGVFDTATSRWYGWGGYDSTGTNATSLKARGLWYDNGTPLTGSQDGAGNPIPLVSADSLDACIVFLPSGRASYLEFKQVRRGHDDVPVGPPWYKPSGMLGGNFLAINSTISGYDYDTVSTDMQKGPPTFTMGGDAFQYDIPEVAHFVRHTGGYHITLAADALNDETTFPDARSALRAIGEMQRVYVGVNGTIRTQRVQVRDGYTPPTPWWPSTAATWLDTAAPPTNVVYRNCRLGWLHAVDASASNQNEGVSSLRPRGSPVSYIVSPDMLVNRTWWRE